MAIPIPISTGNRKRPLTWRQNSFRRNVPSSRRAVPFTLLIDSINSS